MPFGTYPINYNDSKSKSKQRQKDIDFEQRYNTKSQEDNRHMALYGSMSYSEGGENIKKRKRVNSEPCTPTSPQKYDSGEYSLSSLRQDNPYSSPFDDLWPALWLHPRIDEVVETMYAKVNEGFNYRTVWEMEMVANLQIIYRLSASTASNTPEASVGERLPQNVLLSTRLVFRCVKFFSQRHVDYQIAPDCFIERSIQIRALASFLSLLHLLDPSMDRKPRLITEIREEVRSNIEEFRSDLAKSQGSAADKGDCEFMARYALNLLNGLPGDDTRAANLASSFMNVLFAAGMAYAYNGPAAIEYLRLALRVVDPKPSEWHADFDRYHHLTIIVLSWSLYYDARARAEFRELCCDFIRTFRQKLLDGLTALNDRYSSPKKVLGKIAAPLFPVAKASDSQVHTTYGILYLIGRLVERYMVDSEEDVLKDPEIVNLRRVLAWACRNSKYGEIRFKSYEILFCTFSRSPNFPESPPPEQIKDDLEQIKGRIDKQEWDMHLDCLSERRRLVDNALFRLNLDDIHRLREEYEKQGKQPLTPPAPDMMRNLSRESHGSIGRRSVYQIEFPGRRRPSGLGIYPPSPTSSNHSDSGLLEEPTWKESPVPFPDDTPIPLEPERRRIKSTPVCTRISRTGKSLAALSRNHVDVYAISISECLDLTQRLEYDAPKKLSGTSQEFIAVALNDECVVAISRNQFQVLGFGKSHYRCTVNLDTQRFLRLCSVAVSCSTLIAVGLISQKGDAIVQLYELHESEGKYHVRHQRTLEFGECINRPHGEPHTLSFSPDGTHIACTSSVRGDIVTWNLDTTSDFPSIRTVIPGVNDGMGFGVAGVTSANIFPSSRYILATTGSSTQPAVIKALGDGRCKPDTLNISEPQASIVASAVATKGNAFSLLTKKGRIFVSRLDGNGLAPGYVSGPSMRLAQVDNAISGDLEFGMVGERQILVAAFITSPRFKSGYYVDVLGFKF
ncbi:hypothetical protein BDD12DRAFT_859896 [Trichophaea hybrida]|nr:hypothetical protein BDD12DRAFT_859896 [Trichophaea hybrida]